jgi:hypothetical protein
VLSIEPDRERISLSLAQVDLVSVPDAEGEAALAPESGMDVLLPLEEPLIEDFDAALEAEADQAPPQDEAPSAEHSQA